MCPGRRRTEMRILNTATRGCPPEVYAPPVDTARALTWGLAGAAAGAVTHRVVQQAPNPAAMSAALLVTAALAYPVTDLGAAGGPARRRELISVGAAVALGLASALLPHRSRRRLLAAGWLAHAGFDAAHHRNESSVLPGWYPPLCAGFDAVVAARLLATDSVK